MIELGMRMTWLWSLRNANRFNNRTIHFGQSVPFGPAIVATKGIECVASFRNIRRHRVILAFAEIPSLSEI